MNDLVIFVQTHASDKSLSEINAAALQVFEAHSGVEFSFEDFKAMLEEKLNEQNNDGISWDEIEAYLNEHGIDAEKKAILYDLYLTHENEIQDISKEELVVFVSNV
jgi:hypothetical protein